MNPEFYSYLFPKLIQAGALDVFLTHIVMKKNRPGIKLSVLTSSDKIKGIEDIIFSETTTLGLRKYGVDRPMLEREYRKVNTRYGVFKIKVATKDGCLLKYAPEYEACAKKAEQLNVPLKEIYEEVLSAAREAFYPF